MVQTTAPMRPSNQIRHTAVPQNSPKFPHGGDALSTSDTDALTERQLASIELLLSGKPMATTVAKLGIDRKTLYNWRQLAEFRRELARRRRELWDGAADRLRNLIHPSIDVLEEQIGATYDRTRYRAAVAVLRISNLRKSTPPPEEEEGESTEAVKPAFPVLGSEGDDDATKR